MKAKILILLASLVLGSSVDAQSRSYVPNKTLLSSTQVSQLRSLAKKGSADAQTKLGSYFEKRQLYPEAIHYYTMAANQGAAQAQFNLAQIYEEGRGTKSDMAYALSWYEEAARNGYKVASEKLRTLGGAQ